jgi:hypothetical protein
MAQLTRSEPLIVVAAISDRNHLAYWDNVRLPRFVKDCDGRLVSFGATVLAKAAPEL